MSMEGSGGMMDAGTAERELTISRVLEAPPRLVFMAWTKPEHLVHWWGPRGFTVPSLSVDLRPDGAFRACLRAPDGVDHWVRGNYRDLEPPARLAFTWAWENEQGEPGHETLVTVTLEPEGTKTKLTLHQALFETVTARDGHEDGWTQCLDRLAEFLGGGVRG